MPGDLLREQLALTRVKTARISSPRARKSLHEGHRAPDRARRPVERRQEAIPGGVDLAATETLELLSHYLRGAAPAASPTRWSPSSAARSVEPTMSVKRTVARTRSGSGAGHARQELLDLAQDRVRPCAHPRVVGAGELDEARPGNLRGDVLALLDLDVASPVRCRTRVGTRIEGSTCRTSICSVHPQRASAAPGLAQTTVVA